MSLYCHFDMQDYLSHVSVAWAGTVAWMLSEWKRRRAARRVKPGDGHALKPIRWWQLLNRTQFHLSLTGPDGQPERWSVDIRLWGDSDGEVFAHLFRNPRSCR